MARQAGDFGSPNASWVIVCRDDGFPVFETWSPKLVRWLNTTRYRAVPILEYLGNVNRQARGSA